MNTETCKLKLNWKHIKVKLKLTLKDLVEPVPLKIKNSYTKKEIRHNRHVWIRALKSGLFNQTRDTLADKDGYCCLGVAAKILAPKRLVRNVYDYTIHDPKLNQDHTGGLPDYMARALGLSSASESKLIDANDTKRFNFNQIAAMIRDLPVATGDFKTRAQNENGD